MGAGEYYFLIGGADKKVGVVHGCPCGCGRPCALLFRGCTVDGQAEWDVTGDWPDVTLTPSIGVRTEPGTEFHWHGFLRNGVFEEC